MREHVGLLCQRLSEPEYYGDLVYELKKNVGTSNFTAQFIKINSHYKKDWFLHYCIATNSMLGGHPNHGWQQITHWWVEPQTDGSDLKMYL